MSFNKILEGMLESAGALEREESRIINLDHNAYFWGYVTGTTYWDPMLEKIFEGGFELSERREKEISETLREVLQNSRSACNQEPNKKILCKGYLGTQGIVYDIVDGGPGFDHVKEVERAQRSSERVSDEDLLNEIPGDHLDSGNGMLFVVRFPTEFHYNKKGSRIALRFDYRKGNQV